MLELAGVGRLPNLKWLRLEGCQAHDLDKVALPTLERVALPYNLTTDQLARFVQRHPKLTHLTIAWKHSPGRVNVNFGPVSQLKQLSSLAAAGMRDLDPVRGLHHLTHLHIVGVTGNVNTEPLRSLTQLRFLVLSHAGQALGWETLNSLPNVFYISPFGYRRMGSDVRDRLPALYGRGAGDGYSLDIPAQQWR